MLVEAGEEEVGQQVWEWREGVGSLSVAGEAVAVRKVLRRCSTKQHREMSLAKVMLRAMLDVTLSGTAEVEVLGPWCDERSGLVTMVVWCPRQTSTSVCLAQVVVQPWITEPAR